MKDFYWVTEETRQFMEKGYLDSEQTVEERVREIADHAEKLVKWSCKGHFDGFADKFYEYMAKGWYSLSTPVWVNFGKDKGLPISCFGTQVQDDTFDILRGAAEIGAMSKVGGGTATYFGNLRPRGSKISTGGETNGSVSMMELFNTTTNVISQGKVRRGSWAAYLDVEHPDIEEVLQITALGAGLQLVEPNAILTDDGNLDAYTTPGQTFTWRLVDEERINDAEARPYVVQYDEDDISFVSRLLEEEGISYHFEHGTQQWMFVMTDYDAGRKNLTATLPLGPALLGREVNRWCPGRRLRPKSVALDDYNWKKPQLELLTAGRAGVTDFMDMRHPWPCALCA